MGTTKLQMKAEKYVAPEVEAIEIAVEKGFAASTETAYPGGSVEEL